MLILVAPFLLLTKVIFQWLDGKKFMEIEGKNHEWKGTFTKSDVVF